MEVLKNRRTRFGRYSRALGLLLVQALTTVHAEPSVAQTRTPTASRVSVDSARMVDTSGTVISSDTGMGSQSAGIFYPRNSRNIVFALNLNVTIAPREVVRDEIRQIPQLSLAMRMGLPKGFGLGARLATNYVASQLSIIPSWSHTLGQFSFAAYTSSSLWFGLADFTGFNTFAMGFSNAPGIITGYQVDDYLLAAGVEAITNYWHYTKFGNNVVHRQVAEYEGEAYTFIVEQQAFGGRRIDWGVRFEYTTPGYQLWLAFSDLRKRSLTPSFFFGLIL